MDNENIEENKSMPKWMSRFEKIIKEAKIESE